MLVNKQQCNALLGCNALDLRQLHRCNALGLGQLHSRFFDIDRPVSSGPTTAVSRSVTRVLLGRLTKLILHRE
jgi:hypothetical protein